MDGAGPGGIAAITAAFRDGLVRPGEIVESAASAVDLADAGAHPVNAFLAVDLENAARVAEESERRLRAGSPPRPLEGIPIAVKDNIATERLPTTCGSRVLEGYRSPFEATAVRRLREAGGVVLGKTNLDEFGMGSSTEHSAYGATRNPLDRDRVPGGSSGGSAAAVAAGIVPAALGSDTGGSVRQPAAFCGVVGLRPTYGRVSRHGLVAYASSLDQIGTLGRTVDDAATLLAVIAGHDALDPTSVDLPVPEMARSAAGDLEGTVVGVPDEYFPDWLEPGVRAVCDAAIERLSSLGAEIRPVELPHTRYAISAYYLIAPAEASSNLARFDGIRYGIRAPGAVSAADVYERTRALLGSEVKRRVVLGTFALSVGQREAYYLRARTVRRLVAEDFGRVFGDGVDLVFTPTTPTPTFRLGEKTGDPYGMYRSDVFTVPASLAGLPAISLPVGLSCGLPVGGQLVAPRFSEGALVRGARALESRSP